MVGLPKSIIAKYGISKKAWSVFRGRGRGKRGNPGGTVKVARRGRRYPPRRSFRRHFRRPKTIPMGPVLGAVGGLLLSPTASGKDSAVNAFMQGYPLDAGKIMVENLTGYDVQNGNWNWQSMMRGWTPILAGVGAHYLANALGLNRMMARLPSPLNKARI